MRCSTRRSVQWRLSVSGLVRGQMHMRLTSAYVLGVWAFLAGPLAAVAAPAVDAARLDAHAMAPGVAVFLGFRWGAVAAPAVDAARLHAHAMAQVVPVRGYQSRVVLGDSIVKLAREGVIDAKKLEALYAQRGGLPEELKGILTMSSRAPMLLTAKNATLYVNILWALGLANHMETNSTSPLNGPARFNYASTGGWTLGREANGGASFNKIPIAALTPQQEALVTRVAQHSFRPC